jgi:hypothetical protein
MVGGAINPSTSYYYLVDIHAGQIVDDFGDDNSAASFSHENLHRVTTEDCPHFVSTPDDCSPNIEIDDKAVYSVRGSVAEVVVPPAWSQSEDTIGFVVHGHSASIVVAVLINNGQTKEVAVPLANTPQTDAHWIRNDFFVTGVHPGLHAHPVAWRIDVARGQAESVPTEQAVDQKLAAAKDLRSTLRDEAAAAGLQQPDFWCADCALAALPRGRSDD